ncbi:MAG: hypothetical protein QXO47_10055 [Thermoproteota archaeon]
MSSYCDDLYRELEKFLDSSVVKLMVCDKVDGDRCTIQFARKDAFDVGGDYSGGVLWVDSDHLHGADLVVPVQRLISRLDNIRRVGCKVEDVRVYDASNSSGESLAHVHFKCYSNIEPSTVAKILTG